MRIDALIVELLDALPQQSQDAPYRKVRLRVPLPQLAAEVTLPVLPPLWERIKQLPPGGEIVIAQQDLANIVAMLKPQDAFALGQLVALQFNGRKQE